VIRFLARALHLAKGDVTIERGATARLKFLRVPEGTSLDALGPRGGEPPPAPP